MKVVMVARDTAPSSAFKLVAEKLAGEVKTYLAGGGKSVLLPIEEIASSIRDADVLLSGMSSAPELVKEEIVAISAAHDANVPVVLYADTHNSVRRPHFESVRNKVSAMFVVSKKEAEDARKFFALSEDRIILSGNPLVENAHFPKTTREEVRKRFGVRDDEKIILSSGYKFPSITLPTLIALVDAAAILEKRAPGLNLFVFASLHPGDDAWVADKSVYNRILDYFLNCKDVADLNNLRIKVTCSKAEKAEDKATTAELLPATDLLVTTLSTSDEEAACQRIPAIEFFTGLAMSRMEKNFSTRKWEKCEQGVAAAVYYDTGELALLIENILSNGVSPSMRLAQETHYPKPPYQGYAVDKIIEGLKRIAKN
ncbi:MAG: hypothetical protein UW30_C0006G0034 [Candidatus Giovannonibacteria bacterium GW2011_GWA2_44_13b]|uniref:UDP-N-acetylglucosamine 2-epimerase n=2 Tax=Candidatus Giovannoniibacteriota TaxID=1752738 RepID=A0A0G1JC91_9BACT|nr:MAG: hypothetical protein UW30_C0006G0034 [Candidatus Giovannonibacteria bacterium GW2011_GWA2_44_13b]OGF82994.1 MAG: hypothetical protein A2924_04565 [Candidatus Giovannonibacteria bacterium RIFCSPLOWO2_01_FULL_44_16]